MKLRAIIESLTRELYEDEGPVRRGRTPLVPSLHPQGKPGTIKHALRTSVEARRASASAMRGEIQKSVAARLHDRSVHAVKAFMSRAPMERTHSFGSTRVTPHGHGWEDRVKKSAGAAGVPPKVPDKPRPLDMTDPGNIKTRKHGSSG